MTRSGAVKREEEAKENPAEGPPRAEVCPLEPARRVLETGQCDSAGEGGTLGVGGKHGQRRMDMGWK